MKHIQCLKCGNDWMPRVEKPIKCPRCFLPLEKGKFNIREVKNVTKTK